MKAIAIIPARGGSKRLPRKNILPVLDKPMLSYPVKAALESRLFDQVIVSTEDSEIKAVAQKAGAEVFDRPKHLARDRVGVADVCADVLEQFTQEDRCPSFFCCIYATAIFITPEDFNASYHIFNEYPNTEVVMGVSKYNLQPVQALETSDNGWLSHKWPEFIGVQSQFQPKLAASNGTLYWSRAASFFKNKTFYPKMLRGYEIPWMRALDIDTKEDYQNVQLFAEQLMKEGE